MNAGDLVIEPGDVMLLSVDLIHSMRNVLAYEADMHSKHVEFATGSSDDGRAILWLHATEETLHAREPRTGTPTVIRFPVGTSSWTLIAGMGRYSTRAVLYETRALPHERRQLWCPRRGNV